MTAIKTIDAKHARGIGLKVGVRRTRTRRTRSAVKRPCNGVHSRCADCATRAERDNDPAIGYDRKNAPAMFAMPSASSS